MSCSRIPSEDRWQRTTRSRFQCHGEVLSGLGFLENGSVRLRVVGVNPHGTESLTGVQLGNTYSRVASLTLLGNMNVFAPGNSRTRNLAATQDTATLSEAVFDSMLTHERLRTERTRTPFVLMLLDAKPHDRAAAAILKQAAQVALLSKRETDLLGWYKENAILGVIFIELNLTGDRPITEILKLKVEAALVKRMGRKKAGKISISLHVFPEFEVAAHSDWIAVPGQSSQIDKKESLKSLTATASSR